MVFLYYFDYDYTNIEFIIVIIIVITCYIIVYISIYINGSFCLLRRYKRYIINNRCILSIPYF